MGYQPSHQASYQPSCAPMGHELGLIPGLILALITNPLLDSWLVSHIYSTPKLAPNTVIYSCMDVSVFFSVCVFFLGNSAYCLSLRN